MTEREGHFMPPTLVDSQFAALEPPGADEDAVVIDIAEPGAQAVARLKEHFMEENQ
jgi:gluconokinase